MTARNTTHWSASSRVLRAFSARTAEKSIFKCHLLQGGRDTFTKNNLQTCSVRYELLHDADILSTFCCDWVRWSWVFKDIKDIYSFYVHGMVTNVDRQNTIHSGYQESVRRETFLRYNSCHEKHNNFNWKMKKASLYNYELKIRVPTRFKVEEDKMSDPKQLFYPGELMETKLYREYSYQHYLTYKSQRTQSWIWASLSNPIKFSYCVHGSLPSCMNNSTVIRLQW